MNKIYGKQEDELQPNCCESSGKDIEVEFINSLCCELCVILQINYRDERIVKSLLNNILSKKLNNHGENGLLQQYEEYILDKVSERIIKELELGDVKVNHEHARHAKFADIVDKIKEKYIENDCSPPKIQK